MALIECFECGKDVSSKASACPGCGHPILSTTEGDKTHESVVKEGKVAAGSDGAKRVAFILGVAGLVTIFLVPPAGIAMLITAGIIGAFGTKEVDGLVGDCPHCFEAMGIARNQTKGKCPFCSKPFRYENDRFVKTPSHP